jgi:hypothetical protein
MNVSVLEKNYEEAKRPYSMNELLDTRNINISRLRLGQTLIKHTECNHVYLAKLNGKKEKEVSENKILNGNCSVCWKLNRTPNKLKESAKSLINDYMNTCQTKFNPPKHYAYLELENDFYTWLYKEFNPDKNIAE